MPAAMANHWTRSRNASARGRGPWPVAHEPVGRRAWGIQLHDRERQQSEAGLARERAMSRFCRIGPLAAAVNSNSREGSGATMPATVTVSPGVSTGGSALRR
jgi:hypothetical protein